ncbi:MAG: lysophospholipase [Clostridia bacterium]|nr:lysophospholipase [Clostridia bacterium]
MISNDFSLECRGESLHCISYEPAGEVRAVLCILHGMLEYGERYSHFAEYLVKNNIAVVAYDHPGHGRTAKAASELGYIKEENGSEHMALCAVGVIEKAGELYPEKKVFVLGHSMGSFVLRRIMTTHSDIMDGAVVVGTGTPPLPMLRAGRALAGLICKLRSGHHPSRLLTNMSFAGYNKGFDKSEGPHAWISSDREVVKKYEADPFCSYTFRAAGFKALYDTLIYLAKKTDTDKIRKDLPVLVTAGAADPVGENGKGPRAYFELCSSSGIKDVTLKLYDGGRHEIINEKNKEEVYRDILSFITDRV